MRRDITLTHYKASEQTVRAAYKLALALEEEQEVSMRKFQRQESISGSRIYLVLQFLEQRGYLIYQDKDPIHHCMIYGLMRKGNLEAVKKSYLEKTSVRS